MLVVSIFVGMIGAALGAASAHQDGAGLMAVMAVLGAAFCIPVGAAIFMLACRLFGRGDNDWFPSSASLDGEQRELPVDLENLREHKAFSDDYYPGNPDPDARVISGWDTPARMH